MKKANPVLSARVVALGSTTRECFGFYRGKALASQQAGPLDALRSAQDREAIVARFREAGIVARKNGAEAPKGAVCSPACVPAPVLLPRVQRRVQMGRSALGLQALRLVSMQRARALVGGARAA